MEQGSLSLLCAGQNTIKNQGHRVRREEHIPWPVDQRTVAGGLSRSPHGATDRDRR